MLNLPTPPSPPTPQPTPAEDPTRGPFHRRHVLYPNRYVWLLLLSALDIMLTHTILGRFGAFGGRELNSIADWVIKEAGLWGAIGLKFLTMVFVVVLCETVGRMRPTSGHKLINILVVLSTLPVAWELLLLAWFAITGG